MIIYKKKDNKRNKQKYTRQTFRPKNKRGPSVKYQIKRITVVIYETSIARNKSPIQ